MGYVRKRDLIEGYGALYSDELGIRLRPKNDREIFKWFLASVLFGAPIGEKNAKKTYGIFDSGGVTTPERILKTGWEGLVRLLDEGGYTRYDFKTADKLLEMASNFRERYGSSMTELYARSRGEAELERNLKALAKGVGPITIDIFLREMSGIWKVRPEHTPTAVRTARSLKIKLGPKFDKRLEAALVRYAHSKKRMLRPTS